MNMDRLPPQDIETEAACLASALLSRDALYKVTEILIPEDFYLDKHSLIYDAIQNLEKKNLPIDLTTVKQILTDSGNFERVGGTATLAELYQGVSNSANAEYYAKRIKELSLRRKLIEVTTESLEKCYDRSIDTAELMDDIEREIFQVTEKRIVSDYKAIENVLQGTLEDIGKWYETKELVTGLRTGFDDLDNLLTGFHGSELLVLAARPGMGKTAIALNMMNNIAVVDKKATLFFSLEMPAQQLAMRMLCIEAMVDSQRVRTGHISSDELHQLFQASSKLGQAPIFLDDTPSVNILEIRAKARRLAQRQPLGIVIIDYLQLISSLSKVDRQQQVSEISRFLKQLSRELDVPVLALSQLSRAVESRTDQRPQLSDLRESGAIEQDADVVMFIYREEKVNPDTERKGIADVIVAKQRSGPIGDIALKFWDKYTKFSNLTEVQTYDEASPNNEFQ